MTPSIRVRFCWFGFAGGSWSFWEPAWVAGVSCIDYNEILHLTIMNIAWIRLSLFISLWVKSAVVTAASVIQRVILYMLKIYISAQVFKSPEARAVPQPWGSRLRNRTMRSQERAASDETVSQWQESLYFTGERGERAHWKRVSERGTSSGMLIPATFLHLFCSAQLSQSGKVLEN